jgi:hypothetical protein
MYCFQRDRNANYLAHILSVQIWDCEKPPHCSILSAHSETVGAARASFQWNFEEAVWDGVFTFTVSSRLRS